MKKMAKEKRRRIFSLALVLCFAFTMVILHFVTMYRTQLVLNRLEQLQQQQQQQPPRDKLNSHQLSLLPRSSRTRGKKKSDHDNVPVTTRKDRPVYFLHKRHLNMPHDAFSATFWQSKERFLRVHLDRVQSVEGAVFEQFKQRNVTNGAVVRRLLHEVRMTVDWLDFSVEHLSKWWRTLDYDRGPSPIAYHTLVHKLLVVIQKMDSQHDTSTINVDNNAMSQTVAVIAYMPYYSHLKPEWGKILTVVSVAATVASLTRHGIGHIIVVNGKDDDTTENHNSQALVQAAFRLVTLRHQETAFVNWEDTILRLIKQAEKQLETNPRTEMQIDHSTVALANVNATYSWIVEGTNQTNYMTLVPRAALEHLQKALRGESPDSWEKWLGPGKTPNDYSYVYLTEPDTILQMRPSAMESIRQEMDAGHFLVPHRIQPAPHETDVSGYKDNRHWIPNYGIMSNITSLYSDQDACCDDGIHRPKDDFSKCNSNWWACGYTQDHLTAEDRVAKHERVHPYALIRLAEWGTNLVLHAATNHGRRCVPQRKTRCSPPP